MCLTNHFLLISFPVLEQKGEEGMEKRGEQKREEENRRKCQDPEGVAPPSFLSHSWPGLESFHNYVEPSAKTREAWVFVGSGARDPLVSRGPYAPTLETGYVVSSDLSYDTMASSLTTVGGHKMQIFIANIPRFHSRYIR
jgi:hypothetical protein